ncbi:MAG: 4Fe-4S binding protein [Coriobacteriia bacterium]|nr:4Fe-4S binding protein [Coriobacteriia bacterium]
MRPRRQMVRKGLILGFFLALPLTLNYYSPALMTGGTAERVATFSLFTWTAIFASSLVIGRAFCGYGCPFNGLQTAWEKVSGRPNRRIRRLRWVKYTLWAAWAGAVAAFAVSTGGWQRVDLLYMTPHVVSVDSPASLLVYYVLVAVTLAAAALGKRGFCHYFCPFGVWGILGARIGRAARLPMLRLAGDPSACTGCRACEKACPMGLPVSEMASRTDAFHTERTLCGSCVDACSAGSVRYSFARTGPGWGTPHRSRSRSAAGAASEG